MAFVICWQNAGESKSKVTTKQTSPHLDNILHDPAGHNAVLPAPLFKHANSWLDALLTKGDVHWLLRAGHAALVYQLLT